MPSAPRLVQSLIVWLTALTLSAAASHEIVRVSAPEAVGPVEVAVAINPRDPANVVAVSFQTGRPGEARVTNYVYVSRDGGRRWTTVRAPNPDRRVQGDDAIAFDHEGIAYRSYISFEGIRTERPARAVTGIFVSRSSDGGTTWTDPVAVVDHRNTVLPFEDKPWLVVDDQMGSPQRGNVYLAWTRFDEYGTNRPDCRTQIMFSRSVDGGSSFAMPYQISDTGGDCIDSDGTVEGAVPSIGPKGEVYLVWAGPPGLVFDRSLDGGLTFTRDVVIASMPGGWDMDVPGLPRANGMPVTGVDHSNGPDRGTLYVNWIDERHGDPDVFVMASRDGGRSWSDPVRVNDDPRGNGKIQFFTWMAVDPVDGSVNVVFHDRRDTTGTFTDVTVARSVDGGRTFVNYRVNLPAFETDASVTFGDYNGIAARGGLVVAMFPHFIGPKRIALSGALFRFGIGSQDTVSRP